MSIKFHLSGNKKAPVNLYYTNFQPILTSHNASNNIHNYNFTGRNNTDINLSSNLIKSKWNLSEIIDIKKKLNLALKKRIKFIRNKNISKKISLKNKTQMNSINEGILNNKLMLNNTVGNNKIKNNRILTSGKNSKRQSTNNSHKYSSKGSIVKKKINFNNIVNYSTKNKNINQNKKKAINNKIKHSIPFNINKININIINNNNININTIKTERNLINNKTIAKNRKKTFTLDKLPKFDELFSNISIKENKKINNKILKNNKTKIIPQKRNNINFSISNRLNNIITNNDDNSLLSKKFTKNIKKISIQKPNEANDKSINHKKIVPINYFQDYKKKNSSTNKNIKKNFIDFKYFVKIKKIKKNLQKGKNNNFSYKPKRPFSKEEKSNNMKRREKGKEKKKDKKIKNKILKFVAKKVSLPEKLLIKKINKSKKYDLFNIISKSEIKKRRAKSNNKTKNDVSQKINFDKNKNIFYIVNNNEFDIDDVLQNKKFNEEEEIDNFDDLYSIVRLINFDEAEKKDNIFSIIDNEYYLNYKKKFEKIWNNNKC